MIKAWWWGIVMFMIVHQSSLGTYYCVGARSKEICTVIYCKLHSGMSWCFLVTMLWTGEVHASKSISILHDTYYVVIHFRYVLSVVAVGGGDGWEKFWMYWISGHTQLTSGGPLAWGLASRLKLHTITRSMFLHCPCFVNRGRLKKYEFYGRSKKMSPFNIQQMFWEIGYPPPMLVILECGVVIIFQVIEYQYLNDWLHISQFSSDWQLQGASISASHGSHYFINSKGRDNTPTHNNNSQLHRTYIHPSPSTTC